MTRGTSGSGWLDDTRVWSAVSGGDICGLVQADLTQPGAPASRTWTACGPGCLEAPPASLPSDVVVARLSAAAAVVGGDAYLRLESGGNLPNPAVSGGRQYDLTLVTRLADGSLLAAVQQTQNFDKCGVLASERTPLLFPFIETGQVVLVGTLTPGAGSTAWSLPQTGVPLVARVLSNNLGWGMQFDDGTIRILMPPTDAQLKTIDQGLLSTHQGVGALDRIVWSSVESGLDAEVVKGYTPIGGVKILAEQDTDDHAVALSETNVVWIGTTGPQRHDGVYVTAQLFWAPWPNLLGPASIQSGPVLPATHELDSLATQGDYAATVGCMDTLDTCQVLVIQLSTGKLWRIPHRPASVFIDVMVVAQSYILLNEIDNPGAPELTSQVQRLVRLDLAHLDDLEHAW